MASQIYANGCRGVYYTPNPNFNPHEPADPIYNPREVSNRIYPELTLTDKETQLLSKVLGTSVTGSVWLYLGEIDDVLRKLPTVDRQELRKEGFGTINQAISTLDTMLRIAKSKGVDVKILA